MTAAPATIAPRERPILFSGPMVRAILEGRKTQTRRVVDPSRCPMPGCMDAWQIPGNDRTFGCPYGSEDDGGRLWVKETWRPRIAHGHGEDACDCADVVVRYEADGVEKVFRDSETAEDWRMPKAAARGNVSPLFMPRWASRITVEVTGVRIERLQEIGDEDARAEGVTEQISETWSGYDPHTQGYPEYFAEPGPEEGLENVRHHRHVLFTATQAYAQLWDQINGKSTPWASNPLVWVVSFRKIKP